MTTLDTPSGSIDSGRTNRVRPRALAALVAVGLVAAAFGLGIAVAAGLVWTLGLWYPVSVGSAALALGGLLGLQAGYGTVGLVFARRYLGVLPIEAPDREGLAYAVGGGAAAAAVGLGIGLAAAGPDGTLTVVGASADVGPDLLLAVALLTLGLLAPAEELLFRGAVQTRLRRAFGPVGAAVGSGLLSGATYALTYLVYPDAAVAAAAVAFAAAGVAFAAVYERTGTLVAPALAHVSCDAALFAVAYATAAGVL